MVAAMPRSTMSFVGAAIALLGFAGHFLWAPAAALGALGVIVSSMGTLFGINTATTRAAFVVASSVFAGGLAHASGSPWLGASALLASAPGVPYQRVVDLFGYKSGWFAVAATGAAVVLLVVAWPVGPWIWGIAPVLGWSLFYAAMNVMAFSIWKKLHRPTWRIGVGDLVPDFSLKDRTGTVDFRLSEHRGKHVLIAFFRGDWCPVCHVKMRIFQKESENLARLGITLALISPSSGADAVSFAKDVGIDVMFLSDPQNEVATLFGAIEPKANKGADGPLPVSFLLDPEGKVLHASRPDDFASFLGPGQITRFMKAPSTTT